MSNEEETRSFPYLTVRAVLLLRVLVGGNERRREYHTVSREVGQEIRGQVDEKGVEGDGTEVAVPHRRRTVLYLTP